MQQIDFDFSPQTVSCLFDASFDWLPRFSDPAKTIILTDKNLAQLYRELFSPYRVIVMSAGEENKSQKEADAILAKLIEWEADRTIRLVGVGGGVVTDMAGYVASVYKRGIKLGLVPTTILGMVDAALGGKNGINAGIYKNIIGTIYQPDFILFDYKFLKTLPSVEWESGFAEIIKHACIRDELMFQMLERYSLHDFSADPSLLSSIIERNVAIKMKIVLDDPFDKHDRLLLNFGHTIGHAIENLHRIPHGHAVSIGMVAACVISEKLNRLHFEECKKIVSLLSRYHLPVDMETEPEKVMEILRLDKKREGDQIRYVVLNKIGDGEVIPVDLSFLHSNIQALVG